MMRNFPRFFGLLLAVGLALSIAPAGPVAAHDQMLPTLTFPQDGAFCGFLKLCAPAPDTQ